MIQRLVFLVISLLTLIPPSVADTITIKAAKKYLNIPVSHAVQREVMEIKVDGRIERFFEIRLASEKPDYWVFCDISAFKSKTVSISFPSPGKGLSQIYQSDEIAGQDSLYGEKNRPQFHFSSRRGWNNDPNGLLYYQGEYHLFYQHNPYEREWGNMHWGHAVSEDLIHWEELPVALYPDEHGTMFSGSAVMDYHHSAGFNKGGEPAMVALYTVDNADRQIQCLAYSLDKGRTWTKYAHNPVIDSKEKWGSKDTRDPKVFWYEPGKKWVMVLNERDGHSIYNSTDLREWIFKSHITGFWECPELFELPVDNDVSHKKWVMYGASGTYMIGSFNGEEFIPESGKHYYTTGSGYAGQTFNNIPESDGRRIQISWGRIPAADMPFNMLMLLPTELTLRTTQGGVRLFSYPVKEVNRLVNKNKKWKNLSTEEANIAVNEFRDESLLHIRLTLSLSHATGAGLDFKGQTLLNYDMNFNTVNGVFYSPDNMTSMEISADIFIDRTSVEVFIDNGAYSCSFERKTADPEKGFNFWGNNIRIKELELSTLLSIW
ncbi:DUF4980 domain-containing protein [uncultured Proteiniphilum sp.]|uniref:DUF4980 domain-containing protein n=1 Tax=uncultured Proteiniphilum sp. TaxID=497637 RepID=UPI0026389B01|nr:DUF4980 domain-containing protein [uncultured Proteiniphilum sp.]